MAHENTVSFYVSSSFARRDEAKKLGRAINTIKYMNDVSNWYDRANSANGEYGMKPEYAIEDAINIRRADLFIQLINDPLGKETKGGRHVELGIALDGSRTPILLLGDKIENPFQLSNQCTLVSSELELMSIIRFFSKRKS